MKKHIRLCLTLILMASALFTSAAIAEQRLEIAQVRQNADQLVFYTLLTDADTGAVATEMENTQQVLAVAGPYGEAETVSVQTFLETGEGVAYAVVLDLNSYALNATRLATLQDTLKTLLNTLRDADRTLLLTCGKSGINAVTSGFEKNRLTLNSQIEGITSEDRGKETQLYQAVERAVGAFSSTDANFPTRKAVLVFTFGVDNGGMAADVLASKTEKSGVPVYFITLKGKDADGNSRTVDTADLDRIARASHGRVLDGTQDVKAALTLLSSYIADTKVVTVKPSKAAWNALTSDWSVSVTLDGKTVTNDGDGKYAVLLQPTPAPTPTVSRSITLVWDDQSNVEGIRPASVTAHLYLNGAEVMPSKILTAANQWNVSWEAQPAQGEYTVVLDAATGYQTIIADMDTQGRFTATASHALSVEPDATPLPLTQRTVSLAWEDQNDADGLRPELVKAQLMANGENVGIDQELNSQNQWTATWSNLPDDGADYMVALTDVQSYTISAPITDGDTISFTASHTPASLWKKLITPPLLYVLIGVGLLFIALLTLMLLSRKTSEKRDQELPIDPREERLNGEVRRDEQTIGPDRNGEETIDIFTDDLDATLAPDDHRIRIEATIFFQGQQRQKSFFITKEMLIGRSEECDLVLDDMRVSRKHCMLTLSPSGLTLSDLGSRGRTYLNDKPIDGDTAVRNGDTLTLGVTQIKLTIR